MNYYLEDGDGKFSARLAAIQAFRYAEKAVAALAAIAKNSDSSGSFLGGGFIRIETDSGLLTIKAEDIEMHDCSWAGEIDRLDIYLKSGRMIRILGATDNHAYDFFSQMNSSLNKYAKIKIGAGATLKIIDPA